MNPILSILIFIVSIVTDCIFGAATYRINSDKGYAGNGFWWGFFLGIIGLLIVLCKPECYAEYHANNSIIKKHGDRSPNIAMSQNLPANGWRCSCGRGNEAYITSCICGISKYDVLQSSEKQNKETSL